MKKVIVIVSVCLFLFSGIAYADLMNGLVAYYSFSGNAADMSGNGNHGTVNGATLTEDRFGNAGSAFIFDGEDDSITVSDSDSLNFNDDNRIVVSAWVNLSSYNQPNYNRIIGHWSADLDEREYYLGVTPGDWYTSANRFIFAVNSDGSPYGEYTYPFQNHVYSQTLFEINKWYHVVGVYDGTSIKLYVNGIEEDSSEYDFGIYNGTENLYIGNDGYNPPVYPSYSLDGTIDDIRLYNRALSGTEIQELYNFPEPPPQPDPVPEPATMILLGSGLIGLAGFRRKVKR